MLRAFIGLLTFSVCVSYLVYQTVNIIFCVVTNELVEFEK